MVIALAADYDSDLVDISERAKNYISPHESIASLLLKVFHFKKIYFELIGICVGLRLRQRPSRHAGAGHCAEGSEHPLGRYCGSS